MLFVPMYKSVIGRRICLSERKKVNAKQAANHPFKYYSTKQEEKSKKTICHCFYEIKKEEEEENRFVKFVTLSKAK